MSWKAIILVLLMVIVVSTQSIDISDDCVFSSQDVPIPTNAVLYGDPRKQKECQFTSFDDTKPPNLFDPDGLRMWTMEENVMSESNDPSVRDKIEEGVLNDPLMFKQFNRLVKNSNTKKKFEYIEILKAGSTTMRNILNISSLRDDRDVFPIAKQVPFRITSIRHPITRLISGIGHMVFKHIPFISHVLFAIWVGWNLQGSLS